MKTEDVIRIASEVGLDDYRVPKLVFMDFAIEIAASVRAEEREACAKVAEGGRFLHDDSLAARFGKECAEAIRARGFAL